MVHRKPLNILVFPGGTEIGMEINRCLKYNKDIQLYSASSDVSNHASYVYKDVFILPDIYSENWIEELNEIIVAKQIDYLYPANNYIVDALSENRKDIQTEILMPERRIIDLVRSKRRTLEHFDGIIPTPKIYDSIDQIDRFPVFVKPDSSYGSQGAQKAIDSDHLKAIIGQIEDPLILELLPGKEYTIDCFSNRKGELLFCAGRERIRIRMGTSMNGTLVGDDLNTTFKNYAQIIVEELGLSGGWFFQMIEDTNEVSLLTEIEPRIAGTMALNRVRGINFALLTIYDHANVEVRTMINDHRVEIDRALVNRYRHDISYEHVYVDLDDTIIVGDRLNTQVVRFLYQALNQGCRITLLSKSLAKDKEAVLKRHRIHGLFDNIIWLEEHEAKEEHIEPEGAILIDDSFSQRMAVHEKLSILTFDCSMIELLIDDRV